MVAAAAPGRGTTTLPAGTRQQTAVRQRKQRLSEDGGTAK
jgi:hypothetical protein